MAQTKQLVVFVWYLSIASWAYLMGVWEIVGAGLQFIQREQPCSFELWSPSTVFVRNSPWSCYFGTKFSSNLMLVLFFVTGDFCYYCLQTMTCPWLKKSNNENHGYVLKASAMNLLHNTVSKHNRNRNAHKSLPKGSVRPVTSLTLLFCRNANNTMPMRAITRSPPATAIPAIAPVLICDFLLPLEAAPDTESHTVNFIPPY